MKEFSTAKKVEKIGKPTLAEFHFSILTSDWIDAWWSPISRGSSSSIDGKMRLQ